MRQRLARREGGTCFSIFREEVSQQRLVHVGRKSSQEDFRVVHHLGLPLPPLSPLRVAGLRIDLETHVSLTMAGASSHDRSQAPHRATVQHVRSTRQHDLDRGSIPEGDEAKATRPARLWVLHDRTLEDIPVAGEVFPQPLCRAIRQECARTRDSPTVVSQLKPPTKSFLCTKERRLRKEFAGTLGSMVARATLASDNNRPNIGTAC